MAGEVYNKAQHEKCSNGYIRIFPALNGVQVAKNRIHYRKAVFDPLEVDP